MLLPGFVKVWCILLGQIFLPTVWRVWFLLTYFTSCSHFISVELSSNAYLADASSNCLLFQKTPQTLGWEGWNVPN